MICFLDAYELVLNEKIEKQYEFLDEDIDLYVESFKYKIDDIGANLNEKLNKSKKTAKELVI